jgi:putative colanic acid biosynthesis UDP-glucose lipid carrier transferase
MIRKTTHRYSFLILPLIYLLDSVLIFLFVRNFHFERECLYFAAFVTIWFFISYFTKFYEVYRNTKPAEILSKTFKQFIIFDLSVVTVFHFLSIQFSHRSFLKYLLLLNVFLLLFKLLIYVLLKFYRAKGGNIRNFIIVGYNEETLKFKKILDTRKDYGYIFDNFFGKGNSDEIEGDFEDLKPYLDKYGIDVIFCSLRECSDEQIKEILIYADDHFITVKFIPDNKEILGKALKIDYFDYYPVLSLSKSPLDKPVNQIVKRGFDIIFSLLVIIFILSWLTPLLGLIIKLESKGPVFFKQKRNGINYKLFDCYKFRSMRPNNLADLKQVSKNDNRITRIGKILRKTSIDELPQFFNVLIGDMSIVGPRPHMVKENERFLKRIDKFMQRHYIKPGITGLAQVKGFRGEVKTDEDIVNRLKYDLYYIENWSFWLDIKIVLFTILNVLKGEEKAY